MAILHAATLTPTKQELIQQWVPTQPWGLGGGESLELIGAFRFDDPDGRVGMETHLARCGGVLLTVPLTYRDEPLIGAEAALITEMQHSALGTRWVYDGLGDPLYRTMLAGVTMTGQGEALSMLGHEGRVVIAPSAVRIQGGGWTVERVAVDGFEPSSTDEASATFQNDRFELVVWRRPGAGPRPPMGLSATWDGLSTPVVVAQVRER